MTHYAIGDLQGCRTEFRQLLQAINFGPEDHLYLLGDLVNRGADSLGTLQDVMDLEDQVSVVLGNHDLHLLAIYYGGHSPSQKDTFDELLNHVRIDEYAQWLVKQELVLINKALGFVMAHAGIPHIWTPDQAQLLASEVTAAMRDEHPQVTRQQYFEELYGNEPAKWQESLKGMPRLRMITNYLTRMRLIDKHGELEFAHKGAPAQAPKGWAPWFDFYAHGKFNQKIAFGHWAALEGVTQVPQIFALDTGCVWGRQLTALCLETGERSSVEALG